MKTLIVNGNVLEQNVVVQENILMLPFRAVAEALGETVCAADSLVTVREFIEHFAVDILWDFHTLSLIITG
ncbi:MAG: copper amine oxidase N-terminal domain-containing protein [Defluviitaleaceae bacterium]|nr:copper amine oxidase N-terminal domain-containing protein [Defluviitaleaceae bacterium]MCL2263132.1 copper amine oxidase N-terminal domain-containing protein [Defluviitaleaceae bacterium]